MNKFYLYINKDDELGDVIEKMRKVKEREIILVIPEKTKSLSHHINLEILKREVENLGKNVYVSTTDERIKALARSLNLSLFLEETEEKIFDIRPPKKKEEKAEEKQTVVAQSKPKLAFSLGKFFSYLFILAAIFLFLFVLFQVLQTKAEIIIETQKTYFDINEIITLKENQLSVDYENKILPGEYIKVEIFGTETVTTTGRISEEKPLLNVVFYNYLERDVPLVMGTRLSYNGNIFRTTEKIIIPSAQNNEPGEKKVTAILSSLKDEDLKIPQGTDLKIVAWEENKTRTEDGRLFVDVVKAKVESDYNYTSSVKTGSVAPEDVTNVKLKLEEALKKSVQAELAFKNPQSFYIFEPDLIKVEIGNISHKVGEKADKISATGKAVYETMKTSRREFDDFIKNLVNKEILNENKNLTISQLNIEKSEILDFDVHKKIMTIGVKGKATLVPDLNLETLKSTLKGKTIEEAKEVFKTNWIDKVTIRLFPQWKEKLPEDTSKIKILIR